MSAHYNTGLWGGLIQHKCNYCAFDTLEGEDVIIEHVYKKHRNLFLPEPIIPAAKPARGKNHRRSK